MCEVWRCFGDHSFIAFSANAALNCFLYWNLAGLEFHQIHQGQFVHLLFVPSVCISLFSVSYYDFPELLAFIYSGRCVPPDRNVLFIGRQKIHNFSKQTADMQTERRMQWSQTLAAFVSLSRSVVTEQRWQKIYRKIITPSNLMLRELGSRILPKNNIFTWVEEGPSLSKANIPGRLLQNPSI